ncbi:TIGR02530 family flagellar biosynthesis protein [Bacillus sp. FJAT-49736]|uniref:TIGR02530 family flagellar biosynthesis protein n=1 Tax=Bacillus sp. FJAT-49736 TaxID=2833582 RepID=UPI001BC9C720|nr:TIGR02530 family flagellar biosynthesis protein [Bacillus sp. FJAT-49736]MBS4172522.1 flagellar protein [Bacillus sp. FJAT-49736]
MVKPFIQQVPLQPITSRNGLQKPTNQGLKVTAPFAQHFNDALKESAQQLTISKHASQRMEQRGIKIDQPLWDKIASRVMEAKQKGVNESLVLVKDAALIVSAKNQTVITAMDKNEASSQIFTNISGAIIVD